MRGRYGADQLGRATFWVSLILFAVFILTGLKAFLLVALLLVILSYYRMLSTNISRRANENRIYLARTAGIRSRLSGMSKQMSERRHYRIYRCPNCRQKIRIPKGKGNILITCPKCHIEFNKKS